MNTNIKYTTYMFTCLNHMFQLPQCIHHQAVQNHEKEIVYINM